MTDRGTFRDTTTKGLTFSRPLPQGSAPPGKGAFWTDEYGWLIPTDRGDVQRAVLAGMVQYTLLTNNASIAEQLVAVDNIVSETVDIIMTGGLEADRD